ncbi:glycosyltransferase family 4 protein [Sediminibacter sp. Hel_I_10]|uniref:glycosyltransferase family 4 protein n=1 Tax=Sediminibacter sp. Hel_I_10 TaxID=1392490 RepID=UPI0018CC771B
MAQRDVGLNPVVVSSPFQNGISDSELDIINDIKHYRTYNNKPDYLVKESKTPLNKRILKSFAIFSFYKKVKLILSVEKPDILHAHATFFCAIVAIVLGRKFKIPVVYEVRSLWEEREKNGANNYIKKIQPKIISYIETECMKRADKVIVINENLRQNISDRGIRNVEVITNAVSLSLIDKTIDYNQTFPLRFGYIGSVSPIEGLDLIIKLWAKLESEEFTNKFYIYGSGTFLNELINLKENLGVKNVIFKGRVESDKINLAFKNIDVIINPRIKSKISDTVTPLKPLEAMAYKKLVIASDVGGMKELITDNFNGILFKSDSLEALERSIMQLVKNGLDFKIISQAYKYVTENRSWSNNAKKYDIIYKKLKT